MPEKQRFMFAVKLNVEIEWLDPPPDETEKFQRKLFEQNLQNFVSSLAPDINQYVAKFITEAGSDIEIDNVQFQ